MCVCVVWRAWTSKQSSSCFLAEGSVCILSATEEGEREIRVFEVSILDAHIVLLISIFFPRAPLLRCLPFHVTCLSLFFKFFMFVQFSSRLGGWTQPCESWLDSALLSRIPKHGIPVSLPASLSLSLSLDLTVSLPVHLFASVNDSPFCPVICLSPRLFASSAKISLSSPCPCQTPAPSASFQF